MRNPFPSAIVAGVDGSEHSLATVDVAAAEAVLLRKPMVLLSAHPVHDGTGPHLSLTAHLRRACATWPTVPISARNVTGVLAEQLIDASQAASLVVVGQEPHLADQVAAHSRCPTLMVPPGASARMSDPVLLGVGMTTEDEPAIAFAFEEAAARQVPLLVAHVWSGIPAAAVGTISPFAFDLRQAHSAADAMLAAELATWAEKYPEVPVDRMPLYDVNPAQTLLDASELAGLVVVGGHRRDLGGPQLIGTVTRTVLAHATRPVAVVRGNQHVR